MKGLWVALALSVCAVAAFPDHAGAQAIYELDPIVVTADRISQRSRDALSSLTVITREEIDAIHASDLGEVLRLVPGTQIQQYGSPGNLTQVRLRGSESSHMLFLINGVEINDPFYGGFDIAHLQADEIERVEIVRGTQAALFGADAIGGVVNVILRENAGPGGFHVSGEAGGHGLRKSSVGVNGKENGISYALNVSHLESDGLSERDVYHNTGASAVANIHPRDDSAVSFGLLFTEYYKELPFSYFFDMETMNYRQYIDPNNSQEGELITGFAETKHAYKDLLTSSVRLGASYNRLRNMNGPDTDPGFEDTSLNTKKIDLLIDETIELRDWSSVLLSFQWQDEYASRLDNSLFASFTSVDRRVTNTAVSAAFRARRGEWFKLLAGVRSDDPSLFSSHLSPQIKAAVRVPRANTRIRAGWSEGFRVPTLSDLYFPNYGNPDLHPETARSYEAGIDQPLPLHGFFAQANVSVTLFDTDVTDMIAFNDLTWAKENIAEAHYSGIEMECSSLLGSRGIVRASYTHQRTRGVEREKEHRLAQRPDDAAALFLAMKPWRSVELSAEYIHTGEQLVALTFVTHEGEEVTAGETLDASRTLNMGADYTVPEGISLLGGSEAFIRIRNLFDERYEEIKGYPAPGRTFSAGVRFRM